MWWARLSAPQVNLEAPSNVIKQQALCLTTGKSTQRARAIALHDYVRDHINFGFTPFFDLATPEETLQLRRGHCNPQGALLASLLNAAGIPAKQHFVIIPNRVLDGLADGLPPKLLHSYVEVDVADKGAVEPQWCSLDSYILDAPMRAGAVARLQNGTDMGWGAHSRARGDWDGVEGRVMSQMVTDSMALEDLGSTVKPAEVYNSPANPQRLSLPVRWLASMGWAGVNAKIEQVRAEGKSNA